MDKIYKLENETWEDYAFRNDLFEIIYNKNKEIVDISLPNPDKHNNYMYGVPDFTNNILNKIQQIRAKYHIPYSSNFGEKHFSKKEKSLLSDEDNKLQEKLFAFKEYLEIKQKDIKLKKYKRRIELAKLISETHKEEFEEFLSLQDVYYVPEKNTKEFQEYKETENNIIDKKEKMKNERIELYNKYLKNKEIHLQIIELEKQIDQLKNSLSL